MRETDSPHSRFRHVYAIVRFDPPLDDANPENSVVVVKVYPSRSPAEKEVSRLKKVNAGKGCLYALYVSRMMPDKREGMTPVPRIV